MPAPIRSDLYILANRYLDERQLPHNDKNYHAFFTHMQTHLEAQEENPLRENYLRGLRAELVNLHNKVKNVKGPEDSPDWVDFIRRGAISATVTVCARCKQNIVMWHCADDGCPWCAKCAPPIPLERK